MLAVVLGSFAASESQSHYHRGVLSKYEIGPPAVLLSGSDESRLRSGRAVLQTVTAEDGLSRRLIMVQDIKAPPHVVLGRIMDLKKYPTMVSGVDVCEPYSSADKGGLQTVKSTYEISALHMRFKYFITHTYDPAQRCMVFHLDYDRRSDIDDSVGYWFVDPRGRSKCRVFYSCECKLRGWVPGPVYNMLTKEAVKKATQWVEREAVKEYRASRSNNLNPEVLLQAVDTLRLQVSSQLGGLKLPALPELPSFPPIPQLPALPKLPQRKAAADWIASRRMSAARAMSFTTTGRRTALAA